MDKKIVIFVVEDDPGFNKILTSYLTAKNKWEVHSFHSGEECLENLIFKPDIFLQDIDLPKMSGIEVMKFVKNRFPETEFIFLSGQSDVKVVIDALQHGAFDYIVKENYAKENALNKIDQILKIKNLKTENLADTRSKNALIALLIAVILIFAAFTLFRIFN